MEQVRYEVDGRIGRITIDRPERRNAMSFPMMAELGQALVMAKADEAVRVIVLTGAGDSAFCAGADLGGIGGRSPGGGGGAPEGGADEDGSPGGGAPDGPAAAHEARNRVAGLFRGLWDLGKPTIARVRGYCLAGGFGLALACDLVVAADDAVFGTPEIDVGLWPYMVTVPLLRSMPPKKALELMLTGRRVGAEEAERMGFVNRVVPADQLDAAVDELAGSLASKSPVILRWGRDSFYRVLDMAGEDALDYLHAMLTVTTLTDDAQEGLAAFAEKRKPEWTGR